MGLPEVPTSSRSGEAGEKEAEEGVGIGVEANLGIESSGGVRKIGSVGRIRGIGRIRGAGRAGVGARKTFVVNADVHGLDGAERGIDEEGDGHRVEKGGRLLAPLVVEQSEGVGERRALAEEEGALDFVELELGGVEGHDEKRHAGGKQFLGGRNVVQDVPFGLRGRGRAEAEVAVTALDGAAHHNDALELAEGGGVFVDGGTDVHQRADGDERDLAGVAPDLVEEEGDGVGVRRLGEAAGFGVAALGEGALGRRRYASGYGDVRATGFGKEAVEKLGAGFRVAESCGDAEDLEFGAAESKGYGEGVVDVVADVGVDDNFFGKGFLGGCGGGRRLGIAESGGCQDCAEQDADADGHGSGHGQSLLFHAIHPTTRLTASSIAFTMDVIAVVAELADALA